MWGRAWGDLCIWLQSLHESPDHFMVAGGRLVLPDCSAAFWLAEQKHMFTGEPRQRIYKQGSCRQTGEAYGDNLGNWAVTRHRGITVPKKPRLRELWQLIGQDIFTNDSSLSGPGLSQAAGHPESRGKSTANPTFSIFFSSGMWRRGQRNCGLSTPINPLPNSLKQTSPHTFTCEWWQCAICLLC